MTASDTDIATSKRAGRWPALIGALALLAAELGGIGLFFKHGLDFTCWHNWPDAACNVANGPLISLYCVTAALLLMIMLRPAPLVQLSAEAGTRVWPLAINALGVAMILLPATFITRGASPGIVLPAFGLWISGMLVLLTGLALYVAPLARWRVFVLDSFGALIPVILGGLASPWLATQIRPLWQIDTISDATFQLVTKAITFAGYEVQVYAKDKVIGAGEFFISVAPACSGVEGFALVTLFVSLYLWLFRSDLRFPRAFWLYPLGLLASAAFNVLRITVLLAIGLEGNPDLAVGGFHSHAGWLMFTLVALGIVALAQTVPALQKAPERRAMPAPAQLPFLQDPVVARILPFAVFMFSALLAQSFSQSPGAVYPLRALAMGAVLALFWQVYAAMRWRISPVGLGVGVAVGLLWVLIPVDGTGYDAPFAGLTGGLLVAWFVMRGLGTIVFVPLIEELFFRGYLERRLRLRDGLGWRIAAAVITAALFAGLHDRWAEAFAAGLAFSWAAHRPGGHLSDAITAHAVANALVFAVAVISGNMSIL